MGAITAVDPVGVAMIMPSPCRVVRYCESQVRSITLRKGDGPRSITASFKTWYTPFIHTYVHSYKQNSVGYYFIHIYVCTCVFMYIRTYVHQYLWPYYSEELCTLSAFVKLAVPIFQLTNDRSIFAFNTNN